MPVSTLRVLIAGGGTGGHLYPGIAVARRFQSRYPDSEVAFVGAQGGLEARLLPREGLPFHALKVRPLKGRSRLAQITALGVLGLRTLQAVGILRRMRPHLVVGTGGYVMAPALLAAALCRYPRVILEQNLLPGMAVRVLSRFAQRVFTSFAETADYLPGRPVVHTGTPVRPDICGLADVAPPPFEGRLHVLIFGGSQGARRINRAVLEALPLLSRHQQVLRLVHQTGEADLDGVARAYQRTRVQAEARAYLDDMASYYRWAHVVVCRAGASTLAELTACGKPSILVPYPYAADDHQRLNALAMQRQGAAQVILETQLSGTHLYEALRRLLTHPEDLRRQAAHSRRLGRPQAADEIVTACLQLVGLPAFRAVSQGGETGMQHA